MNALLAPILLLGSFLQATAVEGDQLVQISSGPAAAPMVVAVPAERVAAGVYSLEADNAAPITALAFDLDSKRWLGAVLPAGGGVAKSYRLRKVSAAVEMRHYATVGDVPGQAIAINAGDQLFARLVLSEPSKPYIYPLNGPGDVSYTRHYPMLERDDEDHDHPHQRSLWLTHGDVNGYDFWASDPRNGKNPKFGSIRPHDIEALAPGSPAPLTLVRHQSEWLDPAGKPILHDQRTFLFYGSQSPRFVDVDITLDASHGDATFGDTKEGMFGLRVASSLDVQRKQGGRIVNSNGETDLAAWGKPASWVDYSGPLDGHVRGIAFLNHPESFRYPTHWHVRDYGLFAANPFGLAAFGEKTPGTYTLKGGQSIRFRYRLILHDGTMTPERLAGEFQSYATPPRLEFPRD